MRVFLDTSALYAVLDAGDDEHQQVREVWTRLLSEGAELVCTNGHLDSVPLHYATPA